MALHPYRQDYQEFAPADYRLTSRMTRLFDTLIDRHDLIDSPELSTLVCTVDPRDNWKLMLILVIND